MDDERGDGTKAVEMTEVERESEESEVEWGWRSEGGSWFDAETWTSSVTSLSTRMRRRRQSVHDDKL